MNTRIGYILFIITTVVKADLQQVLQDSASTLVEVTSANQQHQQQFIQILTSLIEAIKLAFSFFKSLFFFLYKCTATILSPIMWLTSSLWSSFIAKPYHLFMHLARVLYPVTLFCIAAICCGLFIGGCAGFAAEAFSSLLISATWGPQPKAKDDDDELILSEKEHLKSSLEETDDDEEDDEPIIKSSANSSIWENSSSFFGVHQDKKKEKEPIVQKPKVELWRESISTASSPPPSVLIRRMKLSSTNKKNSGWDWDEDEDDLYHPSSSATKKHI